MSLGMVRWQQPDKGVLFIVTGASGTGKTTLVKQALEVIPGLVFLYPTPHAHKESVKLMGLTIIH